MLTRGADDLLLEESEMRIFELNFGHGKTQGNAHWNCLVRHLIYEHAAAVGDEICDQFNPTPTEVPSSMQGDSSRQSHLTVTHHHLPAADQDSVDRG